MRYTAVKTFRFYLLAYAALIGACSSTSDKKTATMEEGSRQSDFDTASQSALGLSGRTNTLTTSITDNKMTSKTVDNQKVARIAEKLKSASASRGAQAYGELIAYLAIDRLNGGSLQSGFSIAKQIVTIEMQKDIRRTLPEISQLDLALTSIKVRKLSMAEYWLNQVAKSKRPLLRAAELNARGIIALIDNRLPEAVDYWNQALRFKSDYEPARLNLGFMALTYGDFSTARKMLYGINADWFVSSGIIQAERLANNTKKVKSLCDDFKERSARTKPVLLSCALNTYQGLGDANGAIGELNALLGISGGPEGVDKTARQLLDRIKSEQSREAELARRQKAMNQKSEAKPDVQSEPANQEPKGDQKGTEK